MRIASPARFNSGRCWRCTRFTRFFSTTRPYSTFTSRRSRSCISFFPRVDYRFAVKFGSAQFAGALTAAVILLGQLVNQLGWDVVRTDIYYTFIGRNYATNAATFLEEARAFYADHNIVFWLNVPDSHSYRNFSWALRVLFQDHSVHTPPWSLVVLAFAAAEVVRRLRRWRSPSSVLSRRRQARDRAGRVRPGSFNCCRTRPARRASRGRGRSRAAGADFEFRVVAAHGRRRNPFCRAAFLAPPARPFDHAGRILGAAVFVTAVLAFLLVQPPVYGVGLEPIWRAALESFAGYTTAGAFFISAMILLAASHAFSSIPAAPTGRSDRLLSALAALLAAYLLVYFVFTGYVRTGYYLRYLPLTVYLNDLVVALGLVAMIDCARGWYASFKQSMGWHRVADGVGVAVAALGLAGMLVYWGSLQGFFVRKLPPNSLAFLPILSTPPFRDSSFAALAYGGVMAYFTNRWAYFDANSALGQGHVTLGPDGYHVKRDNAYVWFADRGANAAYDRPEYFFTMTYRGLGLAFLTDGKAARPRAGDVPIIRAIREGRTAYLHPVEVARDPSPLDRWSIVRFDWDFPPFLRPLHAEEFVELHAASAGDDAIRVQIDYRYAHQDGTPEAGTRVTLFAQARCAASEQASSVPAASVVAGAREFLLPPAFSGTVRAEVQPATATKSGPIYGSRSLQVGSREPCPDGSPK